ATGRVTVYSVPELQLQSQLLLNWPIQCAALSPSGQQLALGGEDGGVRFVAIEGCEDRPLVVTATERTRKTASRMQQFFGRSTLTHVYSCACPACQKPLEILDHLPTVPTPCPYCRRQLRFNRKTLITQEAPAAR